MKVLFAVNDEKDAESITRMYQKEFKEIITSKTVYYYNAIIKELQKDKSYDRIVISEDLEMFSSNNYQAVDKFVFEKMDAISDEATNNEGGDIPIILLAMDRRTKNDPLLVKLFGLGIYNVLLGKDRSVQKVAELINKPRSKKEAKAYYRVETEKVSYSSDEDNNGVSESEMQSILNHYKRIGGNIPKCVRSFDSIISQYSEEQAKLIAKSLPKSVTEILEDNSDSYRKLLGIEGQRFPGIGAKKDNDYVEKEIETSSKLKQPVIIPTAVSSKKINRVRSAEEIRRAKLRLEKEKAQEEAQKREEERIEREKAEMARKKREQLLKERAEAEAKRKAEVEAKRKEREKILRERAKAEARRKEEERIAKEKAREEARRKEEERIAREKAEEEEKRKEEEKMAREKAETEAKKKEERKIKTKTVATKSTKEENYDDEIVTTKRRRGRPRKNPVIEEVDENNEVEDVPVKRRRGRPRKNPIIVENEKEDEVVSNRKNTTTKESDNKQNKHNDDIDKDNDLDEFDNLNYNDDEINDDKYYNDKYDDESDIYDDDDFDYDDYDDYDLDDDYKSEDLEEDYNDDKDSKLSEFDDYDDKNLDDTSDYEDEEDDDTLPGFEDYDDEESEDSKDTLDYEDEDKEEDDTLPGFDDYDDEDSEDSKDALDYEDEDEEDDDTLPGFEDYDDEDSEESKDTLDYEDKDEEEDDTLPGFDDYDDEESEESKDTLDYEDEDEEDDDPLPGFDEDEDDNDFKDTENNYKEDDDDIDDMFDYDDEEDNKEEEKKENQTQHNGTFKGINNRNYRYDNNLADSIKDLKETEETQEYNVDTDNLITSNQKIISFVGTSKNGTSFIVNNLAELFSNKGINTAILDLTKNKNSYYVYTNNENELKEKAQTCLDKLKQGIADGVQVNKNLTVYTSLPNEDDSLDEVTAIIHTLLENYSIVLLDCDFDTDVRYFKVAQEIYLVQSLDVLTIQPLTAFLRDLKVKNILDTSKLRIIINKNIKMKLLNERNLIGGMSSYNDPAMTYMTELFDENTIKFITIPFEDQVYVKYLESLVNCNINLKGYSKNFMSSLNKLADMVYPTINGKKAKENYNNFSKNTNSILDKMKKKY